ncbi:AAA family ATPase, partial [Streptococcus pyogenes]
SLRGAHDGDENCSRVGKLVKRLVGLAERTGCAVVLIHHTRKLGQGEAVSANASRGSNAILAMVRSQIGIDKPDPKSDWCRVQMLKEN